MTLRSRSSDRSGPRAAVRLVAVAVLIAAPGDALAQSGRIWQPGERVLITDFSRLGGVAVDGRRAYAASIQGLEIYDYLREAWEAPSTVLDGYPAGEMPSALAWDEGEREVWLGTQGGRLYSYHTLLRRWQSRGFVPGPVLALRIPASFTEGVFVRLPQGWLRVDRGGFDQVPVPEASVPGKGGGGSSGEVPDDPFFRAAAGTLATDDRLRRWPITGVAAGERRDEYWVATDGGNLFRYRGFAAGAEQLAFGMLSAGAGSVRARAGEVWIGGDGRGTRRGVTTTDAALQRWVQHESALDGAPRGRIHEIDLDDRSAWLAADDGVFRFDRAARRWSRPSAAHVLADGGARSVVAVPGGAWAGGRRGLVHLRAGRGEAVHVLAGWPVNGLALAGDTLWIASDRGLLVLALTDAGTPAAGPAADDTSAAPRPPSGVATQPVLGGPVVGVTIAGGEVYAATQDALFRRRHGVWQGPFREASAAGVGRILRLRVGDGQVWVAGDGGVARWDPGSDFWSAHVAGGDLPAGSVSDVEPAGDDVWVATSAGAVRLRWRP